MDFSLLTSLHGWREKNTQFKQLTSWTPLPVYSVGLNNQTVLLWHSLQLPLFSSYRLDFFFYSPFNFLFARI